MNLVEELLKSDPKNLDKRETRTYKSRNMGKALGRKEAVDIKLRAVSYDEIINIKEYITNRDGSINPNKSAEGDVMLCVKSIVDPDLNNEDLQRFCGVNDAVGAAKKLFDTELLSISRAVMELSNFSGDTEDIVKN